MKKKLPLNAILIIFAIIAVVLSVLRDNGVDILTLGLVLFVLAIVLFVLVIIRAFKKEFKPLVLFAGIVIILMYVPFWFLINWFDFQFSRHYRQEIVTSVESGFYDTILAKEKYPEEGTWVESHHSRHKIFKSRALTLILIKKGQNSDLLDYRGELYISDKLKINSKAVSDFLDLQFDKTYLGDNWYWVECYEDLTPGP